jgi:hypothetical protein
LQLALQAFFLFQAKVRKKYGKLCRDESLDQRRIRTAALVDFFEYPNPLKASEGARPLVRTGKWR